MKQTGYMWGCWVVWTEDMAGDRPGEWMWETAGRDLHGNVYCPLVFTETRRAILPLVTYMRQRDYVKSAKAVKVPVPEGP